MLLDEHSRVAAYARADQLLKRAMYLARSCRPAVTLPIIGESPLKDPMVAKLFECHREHAPPELIQRLLPVHVPPKQGKAEEKPKPKVIVLVEPAEVQSYPIFRTYPSASDIIAEASKFYGVRKLDIVSARRTKDVVWPRHVTMFLMKDLTGASYPEIGRRIGNRDHTTALHGCRKVERMMAKDAALLHEIDALRAAIMHRMAVRNNQLALEQAA